MLRWGTEKIAINLIGNGKWKIQECQKPHVNKEQALHLNSGNTVEKFIKFLCFGIIRNSELKARDLNFAAPTLNNLPKKSSQYSK